MITIIGGGIIGIFSALELLERGAKVRLIDPLKPVGVAAYGSAGVISPFSVVPMSLPGTWRSVPAMLLSSKGSLAIQPSHFPSFVPWAGQFLRNGQLSRVEAHSRAMAPLVAEAPNLYRRHLRGTRAIDAIEDSSYIYLYRDLSKLNEKQLCFSLRERVGAEIEVMNPSRLAEVEPHLSGTYVGAVAIHGQARTSSPARILDALLQKARETGAEIRPGMATSLHRDGEGWIIDVEGEPLRAEKVLIASGGRSDDLLAPLGIKVPMEREFGYNVEISAPDVSINNTVYDTQFQIVASAMDNKIRFSSYADFRRNVSDRNIQKRAKALLSNSSNIIPNIEQSSVSCWAGIRPSTPDSLPIIDNVDQLPNLFAAFGHGHYGLSMAPRTGQLIADILVGGRPSIDRTPYKLSRFCKSSLLNI